MKNRDIHVRTTEDLDIADEYVAELQAKSARLLAALKLASNELERIWKEFKIGDESAREAAKSALYEALEINK